MNFIIFYVTDKFLEHVTEENYSNPSDLLKTPHYGLYFELFKYKVRMRRNILYTTTPHHKKFSESKHFENFQSTPILRHSLEIDDTPMKEGDDEFQHIISCANFKFGEVSDADVRIICCDDEHSKIEGIMPKGKYPFKCMTIEDAGNMLKRMNSS